MQQGVPGQNTESALPILDLLQQADLPQYELSAITAILQEAVDVTMDVQQSPEVVAVLRDLVDLLAGGKTRPVSLPSSAMNLSQEAPAADTDISPVVPPTTFTSEASPPLGNLSGNPKSADLPQTESGKRLEFNQWITAQEELASDPVVKPEWLAGMSKPAGFPADVVLKAETAASPLGAILPPDVEMPESFSVPLAPTSTVPGKGGLIAGLQAPAEAQLHTAMRVQVAFGHAQWSEAVAERAAWLAGQQIHSAELQLDPPELGPLQVRVSVHQDQAVVSFVSANPQVREALDQSMMRLRDLLQEQGMQLVDAGVSDQQRGGEGDNSGAETPEGLTAAATPSESPENDPALSEVMDVRYGVDDFV